MHCVPRGSHLRSAASGRDSLLDAPFLWARLIDLDILYKDWNHVWRNELIVRSGAAPLWIKFDSDPMFYCRKPGTITVRVESIVHFFQRIVIPSIPFIVNLELYEPFSTMRLRRSFCQGYEMDILSTSSTSVWKTRKLSILYQIWMLYMKFKV